MNQLCTMKLRQLYLLVVGPLPRECDNRSLARKVVDHYWKTFRQQARVFSYVVDVFLIIHREMPDFASSLPDGEREWFLGLVGVPQPIAAQMEY